MSQPQSGILPEGNTHATFMTFLAGRNEGDRSVVRQAFANLPRLTQTAAASEPDAALRSVVAFGANVWDDLFPSARPAQLRPFQPLEDHARSAPATPGDIFLHIRSNRRDLNFDLARMVAQVLDGSAETIEEVHGFRYRDTRDLTGFVDGTENPKGEARAAVALVGEQDAGFAGGSYIATQRYIHDLPAWEQIPVAQQEQIIGRTKADDVEFASADKAPTAHIKRVSIKEGGKSLEILRHSMPYGTAAEHGLYFVAYCSTPDNFDQMLQRMIIADQDGHYDHLMRFAHAVSGASYFAPPLDFLQSQVS